MEFQVGKLLGKGMERSCYENLANPLTCLKVSKKSNSKQTHKEVKYFRYLEKKGIHPSFMPKFYGLYETEENLVLEQEFFGSHDNTQVIGLREFIGEASDEQMNQLDSCLQNVKEEMLRLNVIVTDMRTTNCLVILENQVVKNLVIFDGYGAPELFPIAEYSSFLGNRKINRQWKKFMLKYNADVSRLRS